MLGNDGAETALAGWRDRIRTAESVRTKFAAVAAGISVDLAETAHKGRFACRLRLEEYTQLWQGLALRAWRLPH
jgi:hypothetical protein